MCHQLGIHGPGCQLSHDALRIHIDYRQKPPEVEQLEPHRPEHTGEQLINPVTSQASAWISLQAVSCRCPVQVAEKNSAGRATLSAFQAHLQVRSGRLQPETCVKTDGLA